MLCKFSIFLFLLTLVLLLTVNKLSAESVPLTNTGWSQHTENILKTLVSLNFDASGAIEQINICKKDTEDPLDCVMVANSIAYAESSGFVHCTYNNCHGLAAGRFHYDTLHDGLQDFVKRYKKYWKYRKPKEFYGIDNPTHYCLTEIHNGKEVQGCPYGLTASTKVYDLLSKLK